MLSKQSYKRNILTIVFAATTLILLAVAINSTVNYYRYYPAITEIKLSITSFQKTNSTGPQGNPALKVTVRFKIENPSNYNGLVMKSFYSTLDVIGIFSPTDNVTAPQGALPVNATTGPLNPGDVISIQFPAFDLTLQAAKLAAEPQTQTQFVFHASFFLSSFLDKATQVIPTYDCASMGDPVTCTQTGLTLQTASGGLGGTGGGGGA